MEKLIGAAVVGQSGGPTAAINATLAGVIEGALAEMGRNGVITKLYGMRNGIEGLLDERLTDLGNRFAGDPEALELLKQTPASALGSCRKKLPDPAQDPAFFERLMAIFRKYNIRYFFYIGGNDSMDTVAKLTRYANEHDYRMRVVGLPKTIDNDLTGTSHTPGYGSAAKYIAATMQEILRDCAVYTVPAVTIVEIMGRDAGWLTAAAALPRLISGIGPDFVYLPERPFSMEEFMRDVADRLKRKPNVVIAVSEGLRTETGAYVGEGAQSGSVDVFGHKYLSGTGKALELAVKAELGCKVRSVELNISQRCAAHMLSLCDISESFSVGKSGVEAAVLGASGCMMSYVRADSDVYSISYETTSVLQVANQVRTVPDAFINTRGNNVTDECLAYIRPLIAGEVALKYQGGLPAHLILE